LSFASSISAGVLVFLDIYIIYLYKTHLIKGGGFNSLTVYTNEDDRVPLSSSLVRDF
jgi:hypothetical protein